MSFLLKMNYWQNKAMWLLYMSLKTYTDIYAYFTANIRTGQRQSWTGIYFFWPNHGESLPWQSWMGIYLLSPQRTMVKSFLVEKASPVPVVIAMWNVSPRAQISLIGQFEFQTFVCILSKHYILWIWNNILRFLSHNLNR